MKILMLSHTGLITGGAEQCLLEYVDVLIARGHKLKVMVPYKGDMTKALARKEIDYTIAGYGWATLPHRNVNPHKIMSSTGNSIVKLFQEVEKFKPSIIITNTAVIPWGLYAGRAFNIPTVLLVHEVLSEKDPSLRMVPSYHEYMEILNRNADYVVYNSEFVKNEFVGMLIAPKTPKSILYPLPPLDTEKIELFYKENKVRDMLKIAIFGALSPRKNQLEALQAAKLLEDKGITNVGIDLYGDLTADPAYTRLLRKFIRENSLTKSVKIKGYTKNVYDTMNEYNVVLSTATYEPFGRTIIEGQLFGRIVITNNTGGGLELVEDLQTGLVYGSGNPRQLAEKIQWIMGNESEAMALGAEAKLRQTPKYLTGSRYDALIESVEFFSDREKRVARDVNLFDPIRTLFEYNHQLNNKYKHLYRITHNRATFRVRSLKNRVLSESKKTFRKFM